MAGRKLTQKEIDERNKADIASLIKIHGKDGKKPLKNNAGKGAEKKK